MNLKKRLMESEKTQEEIAEQLGYDVRFVYEKREND